MPTPSSYWKFDNSTSDYYNNYNLSAFNLFYGTGKVNQAIFYSPVNQPRAAGGNFGGVTGSWTIWVGE